MKVPSVFLVYCGIVLSSPLNDREMCCNKKTGSCEIREEFSSFHVAKSPQIRSILNEYSWFCKMIKSIGQSAFHNLNINILNIFPEEEPIQLNPESFRSLTHLTNLTIGPTISPMKKNLFTGLQSLTILKIQFDGLTFELGDALIGLEPLKELYLRNCNLTKILSNTFSPFKKLEVLDLKLNRITYIAFEAFKGAFNRDVGYSTLLQLDYNRVERLTEGAFSGLKVGELTMKKNSLKRIETSAFKGLEADKVYISKNNITQIEDYAFAGSNISKLYIEINWTTRDREMWKLPNSTRLIPSIY